MPRKAFISTALVFLSSLSCWAQAKTSQVVDGITGIVLTEDGQLANGANVCLSITEGNDTQINCLVRTDKNGEFTVEHVKPGTYQVFAINDSQGYSIQNQSPGEDVTISTDNPWATVTIHQQNRGGIVEGSVVDKVTGKPVQAHIHCIAIDAGGTFFGGGDTTVHGDFHISVPPNIELLIFLTANGYRGWVFSDATDSSRPTLKLHSGERKQADIQLEPMPPSTAER